MKRILIWMLPLFFLAVPTLALETPQESLTALQQAVDQNDAVSFEKYVDMRGLISKGVDLFVQDLRAHPPAGEGDPLLEMLGAGLDSQASGVAAQSMRRLLVEEIRKFAIRGVASGSFSGRPSRQEILPDGGIFSALFADISMARKELRSVRVWPEGSRARATAQLYDFGLKRSYPLQLRLAAQPDGFWKVVDVENMADLIRMVRKEAEG